MASPFVVACSNCSAKLKLKDPSLIGKKVRCPKCSEPFLIKASQKKKSRPAPVDDGLGDDGGFYDDPADEWGDDFGDAEDDWDETFGEDPKPRKSKKKSSSSKKSGKKKVRKKKSSKSAIPLPMIFVMIAFLSLIGVGIFFVVPMLAGNSADRMQWLPNDTEVYIEIKVSEIWKSRVLKPLRTSDAGVEIVKKMKEQGNFGMEDIEKVVIGFPADETKFIAIIHSKKTIDPNKPGPNMTQTTYAGKTVYENANDDTLVFLLNSKTMVVGPKDVIHAAIDRNGECAVAEQFEFLPSRGDIIFGIRSPGNALKNSPAAMMSQSTVDPEKLKTVSGYLDVGSNLDFTLIANFVDSESAQASLTQAQEGLEKGREMLQKQQERLEAGNFVVNRQQKAMVLKTKDILKSVSITGSDTKITTSLKISGSTIEDIVDTIGDQASGFMPGIGNPF